MKFLSILLCASLFASLPAPLLVIDMNGKKPLRTVSEFSMELYLLRSFPIYATDLKAVIEATEQAAKVIDRKMACNAVDTVRAAHTLVIIRNDCTARKRLTVRYVTKIEEQNFLCDFELVRNEEDERKAQQKLLDFSDYLSQ
jgi:hypothetical protein